MPEILCALLALAGLLGAAQGAADDLEAFLETQFPDWSAEQHAEVLGRLDRVQREAMPRPVDEGEAATIVASTPVWLRVSAPSHLAVTAEIDVLEEQYRLAVADYLTRPDLTTEEASIVARQVDQVLRWTREAVASVEAALPVEDRERLRESATRSEGLLADSIENPLLPTFKGALSEDALTRMLNEISHEVEEIHAELASRTGNEDPMHLPDSPGFYLSGIFGAVWGGFLPPTSPELKELERQRQIDTAEYLRIEGLRAEKDFNDRQSARLEALMAQLRADEAVYRSSVGPAAETEPEQAGGELEPDASPIHDVATSDGPTAPVRPQGGQGLLATWTRVTLVAVVALMLMAVLVRRSRSSRR